MDGIPKDPAMLVSFLNLKLRDYYASLEELCGDMQLDREEIVHKLKSIDYIYDPDTNQFV